MSFPVKKTDIGLIERIIMEGMPIDGLFSFNPTGYLFDGTQTPEANGVAISNYTVGTIGGTSVQLGITRCGLCQGIDFQASADVVATFTYGVANGGTRRVVGPAGLRIQPNSICYPKDFIGVNAGGLLRPTSPAGNKVVATATVQAIKFAADLNFAAAKRILFIGDSNTEGGSISSTVLTTGSTISKEDMWSWKLRAWYNSNGNDVRIIDKSIGGKSSIDYDAYRRNNRLDLPEPPDLCIYALGTNDYDPTAFYNNLTSFITEKLNKWPNCKFIIIGPIPKQGTIAPGSGTIFDGQPSDNACAAMRLKGAQVATEIAKPNQVIFIDCGPPMWALTDNTPYSNTETNGSHVHAGVAGHVIWANYIINQITTSHPSFMKL